MCGLLSWLLKIFQTEAQPGSAVAFMEALKVLVREWPPPRTVWPSSQLMEREALGGMVMEVRVEVLEPYRPVWEV